MQASSPMLTTRSAVHYMHKSTAHRHSSEPEGLERGKRTTFDARHPESSCTLWIFRLRVNRGALKPHNIPSPRTIRVSVFPTDYRSLLSLSSSDVLRSFSFSTSASLWSSSYQNAEFASTNGTIFLANAFLRNRILESLPHHRGQFATARRGQQTSCSPEAETNQVGCFYFVMRFSFHLNMVVLDAPSRRDRPCLLSPTMSRRVLRMSPTPTDAVSSKEDEEVLKAEYAKNPKPDKAARIEIVSKVALGEKEVQVGLRHMSTLPRVVGRMD